MKLSEYLKEDRIYIADTFKDTGSFYHAFASLLKEKNLIRDSKTVKRLFIKRESIQSTGIGKGAAAPHIFSKEFAEFVIFVGLIRQGLDFKSPDGMNVFLVFLIMSDDRDVGLHLKTLAHIARLTVDTDLVSAAREISTADELFRLILEKEKQI